MANTLLNPTNLLRKTIESFENNISAVMTSKRIKKTEFEIGGRKAGTTVNVAVPNLSTIRRGATFSGQDVVEESKSVAVDRQWGIDLTGLTTLEMSMKLEDFMEQIMKPRISILAANFESDYLDFIAKNSPNLVGTAGTTPQTIKVYLQAGQKISEFAGPLSDRCMHINPVANTETVNAMSGLFHRDISIEEQFRKGIMGKSVFGFDFYENQSIPVITTGSRNVNATVNATAASGAVTLAITGLGGSATIKAGERFAVGSGGTSCYAVNPLTKVSTNSLQQFVVTADATANGAGVATVSISPSVNAAGANQNISRLPTLNDSVTFVGSASTAYPFNLCWQRDAVCFVSIEPEKPSGVDYSAVVSYKNISMKLVRNYDINNDRFPLRIDVYGGFQVLRPEWVTTVIG